MLPWLSPMMLVGRTPLHTITLEDSCPAGDSGGDPLRHLARLIRCDAGWQAKRYAGATRARASEACVSPLAVVSGVGAGGCPERITGAIAAPSSTVRSASTLPRGGGSKWRRGRQQQRRGGRATRSRR